MTRDVARPLRSAHSPESATRRVRSPLGPVPVHAVWPATRVLPARTQLFVDFLSARLKDERLSEFGKKPRSKKNTPKKIARPSDKPQMLGENQKRIVPFDSAAPSVHARPRSVRPGRRATYWRRFRAQPCSKAIRASLLSHRDRDGRQRGWDGPRPVPQHRDGSSRHKATHEETDQQIQGSLQSVAINRH